MIFISLAVRFFLSSFDETHKKHCTRKKHFYGPSIHEKTRFTRLRSLLLIRRVIFVEDSYKRDQSRMFFACVVFKILGWSILFFGHVEPRERCVCVSHSNAIFNIIHPFHFAKSSVRGNFFILTDDSRKTRIIRQSIRTFIKMCVWQIMCVKFRLSKTSSKMKK